MKLITGALCAILIHFSASAASIATNVEEAIVTDPSISRRCEALATKRTQKVKHRQRLTFLKLRNVKLQKITPKNKISIKDKLEDNLLSIKKELALTNLKIQNIEEDIIRRGCPGLIL
jgi:hypothetical protein